MVILIPGAYRDEDRTLLYEQNSLGALNVAAVSLVSEYSEQSLPSLMVCLVRGSGCLVSLGDVAPQHSASWETDHNKTLVAAPVRREQHPSTRSVALL